MLDNQNKAILSVANTIVTELYKDVLSPAAKIFGEGLGQTISALKIVTLPFAMVGCSADLLLDKYKFFLANAFKQVPIENLIAPDPTISFPIMQNVQNVFEKESLYNMYSNLLSTASNKISYEVAHPAFANIISQLDNIDAVLLEKICDNSFLPCVEIAFVDKFSNKHIYSPVEPFTLIDGYENNYTAVASSIRNLERLSLIQKTAMLTINDHDQCEDIYQSDIFKNHRDITEYLVKNNLSLENSLINKVYSSYMATVFGQRFLSACSK